MSTRPLNILCLDGGGARSLSSLLILKRLNDLNKTTHHLPKEFLPCEIFDMICGTSTGGIIALMLGRLRMNVDDTIKEYTDMLTHVFVGNTAIDRASKLKGWLEALVNKAEPNGDGRLKDPAAGKGNFCHTFVVAAAEGFLNSPPKCFRTFSTKLHPADTCQIWEAARATAAVYPFFDPVTLGKKAMGIRYLAGSYSGSNNPSQLARRELRAVFPMREVGCFLSLGTGVPKHISASGEPLMVAEAFMKMLEDCELVHDSVLRDLKREGIPYFRFSVERGLGDIAFNNLNSDQETPTNGYMDSVEHKKRARQCVSKLGAKFKGYT